MKAVLAVVASLVVLSPAQAGVVEGQSTNLFNAGATCLPALPRYDGDVRKRPLAVVNEGVVPSYVTCNYTVDEDAYREKGGVERFEIMARNQSSLAQTLSCTAVIGVDDGNARYIVKSVLLQPNERKKLQWNAQSYGLQEGWDGPVNMSCLLPPLMGLNEGRVHWDYRDAT